ncbi:hypothetical protein [Owenweeksia hongkongensis]|uniref:hypothetical protein n=1 Tax=Owenweeksia hongkongensis TaxID=253245 RepID=UPI003A9066C3
MAYKILYIEDLEPGSIIHELTSYGFEVKHHMPKVFEETIKAVNGYDLLLFDFRLTETTAIFDAPTIAQTLRTINSDNHRDIPIVLISSETKISDYYKDPTSQDLFDLSLTKDNLLRNVGKYAKRFESLIKAYVTIKEEKFDVFKVLNVPDKQIERMDYRIVEKLKRDTFNDNIFAFSGYILNNLIQTIGPLFGEDVLSARLGISKKSNDWEKLKSHFDGFKYKGIFSDSYNRWWSSGLIDWWKKYNDGVNNLRRLNSGQRLARLKEITDLSLIVQEPTKHAKSTSYWTICKESHQPIDPIDGLELNKKELLGWQEKEYLSIKAALNPQKFDSATRKPIYLEYIKPIEKSRLRSIAKNL